MRSLLGAWSQVGRVAVVIPLLVIGLQFFGGCGGAGESQNKNFYTSGNKEADERAAERMAQDQQLKGEGQGTGDSPALGNSKKSLFDRLGGQQNIEAITDDWVTRMMADPRVNFTRKGIVQGGLSIHHDRSMEWHPRDSDIKLLKIHIAEFLALASGGPSQYQGQEIKSAHEDLHITNDEFDASVGDLKASLDKMNVPNTEQKELLAIVESTREEIVEER